MEIRRYGKTTGMALEALGKALQNPGTMFKVGDDKHENPASMSLLENCILSVVKQLELKNVILGSSGIGLTVSSEYFGTIVTVDGTTLKIKVESV